MILSLHRILTLGRNTLTEAVRQKVLNVLLIFGVVLVACSFGFSQLATPGLDNAGLYVEQIRFVKDFGCGAIGLFGFAIALLSTSQLLPQELEKRTIYTILAKPVRRSEFLLGKFLGSFLLVFFCVALMSLTFAAALYVQELRCEASVKILYDAIPNWTANPDQISQYDADISRIHEQVRDPQLIEAILLIFAKLIMTSAIALLISSFATSWIFTIITTFLIYLIGHLESIARIFWLSGGAETSFAQSSLVSLVALLIPDMNAFSIIDEILANNHIPWHNTASLLSYAGVYTLVLLATSIVIFDYREL